MILMTRRRHAWCILSSLFYYYSFFCLWRKIKIAESIKVEAHKQLQKRNLRRLNGKQKNEREQARFEKALKNVNRMLLGIAPVTQSNKFQECLITAVWLAELPTQRSSRKTYVAVMYIVCLHYINYLKQDHEKIFGFKVRKFGLKLRYKWVVQVLTKGESEIECSGQSTVGHLNRIWLA